ncbi:MAG: tripartite tricarboxylate transporter TctB family protein [Burkholderiales bacterium]
MSRRAQENLVAAALLAVFAGVIWLCQDFGPRARMIPLPLAIFGIILTAAQILWQNLRPTDELRLDVISVRAPSVKETGEVPQQTKAQTAGKSAWRSEAGAFAIVGAFIALIFAIGIFPAAFAFTAAYFALSRQYSWQAGLVYTAVLTAAMYLLFVVALQMQPYHGLLAPLFA